jgi:spermidine synthase
MSAALIFVVHKAEHADVYSPYYALSRLESKNAVHILANGSLHQAAIDTRLNGPRQEVSPGYHLPYTTMGHRPRRALVLGAGSGNDVATLLQNGAEAIDAVEIDPVIIELGRKFHPNRPYDSPRVRIINTDARAFLNENKERYDTIVFGTLDSMTRLSALSNVRLDNFVYTTEGMAVARRHLTPNGALILYFMSANPALTIRIAGILARAFNEAPLIHSEFYSLFNTIFLAGPSFDRLRADNASPHPYVSPELLSIISLPHDDWPFLYLDRPSISRFYLIVMAWIAGLTVAGVWLSSRKQQDGFLRWRHADGPMFLFGLAFLLLETRAVTAMNLVWGGTWLTSAVVFGAILFTVLLGTLAFSRRPWSLSASTIGLTISLGVLYMIPPAWLLTMNVPLRLALSITAVGTPVLFASIGFARLYTTRVHVGHAFGWNLLGAVAGGLAEFGGMVVGLRALLLLALAAYLLAYLLENRRLTKSLQTQLP